MFGGTMNNSKSVVKVGSLACTLLLCLLLVNRAGYAVGYKTSDVSSLQEVLEDVTYTNPLILEAMANYKSVLAERKIAESEFLPTVGTELSAGPEKTDGVITDDIEQDLFTSTAALYARQNLYNGGKSTAFVEETNARIRAAAYEVLNVANRVYLDTAESYINVLKSKELLRIAKENVDTQEQIMRQVREKTESGFSRVSDLYNSESRLALSKASYISRQQDLNQALVRFHRQFGRMLAPEQFLQPYPSFKVPDTVEDSVAIALETHPALQVAKYNIQTKRYTYEGANAAYLPTLDFELRGEYRSDTGGEEGETSIGGAYLTFNYTFYDGGLRAGEKARDYQSIRKENQRSYVERRNVNESVRLAWNIKEAEEYKKVYLEDHVSQSNRTLEAFKEEYSVGRRTLLDLLNMENEYTDAQLAMAESVYSALIADYRIFQAIGVLLDVHDTGLREQLELSSKEERKEEEISEDYEQSRDSDTVADPLDQCDNSIPGSSADPFGCDSKTASEPRYTPVSDSQLEPYIVPAERQAE